MSVVRFYVRNEDGSIEGDETCVIDRRNLSEIAKGFTVLGQHKEFVLEFDPPLLVAEPAREADDCSPVGATTEGEAMRLPRTWTIEPSDKYRQPLVLDVNGEGFGARPLTDPVRVVELDLVLDLLEDLIPTDASDDQVERGLKARGERDALLKAHGRL